MAFSPERVVRRHIAPEGAYHRSEPDTGGKPSVRLDWNESPFGLSPKAQTAYDSFRTGNIYPAIDQAPLREAIGRYLDMPADRIIVGAGLDDVINTIAMTVIDAGTEVIISEPTFGVYRSLCELHGATVTDVPLGPAPDFVLPTEAIIEQVSERTRLVIICNPNNPTGTLFPREEIVRIVESVDCLVAIDEAYAEFSGVSHTDLARQYGNLITLRTMSKFAGLAGFRVGYGVMPEVLMPWFRRAAPAFYNVSAPAAAVAIASLRDLDHLRANAEQIIAERDRLAAALDTMDGVTVYPSATNFLLVAMPMPNASPMVSALAREGLLVRGYSDPSLRHCIRISIGLPKHHDRLIDVIERELAAQREEVTQP
ncbi:MAG: histidinol-phosphate transaminase [Chloroflexota bacterium]|nr:histidinol-phosphate transaminase [Chloroflexota bacterium]